MLDFLSSYTNFASPAKSLFQDVSTTPDYAITVPFDIKSLSYFSLLKAKTLRQTKARWCWFDKASKDDLDAGTRLGTLRFLPYEIRQQIFQIVLDDYFDEIFEKYRANFRYNEETVSYDLYANRSLLRFTCDTLHCSCMRDEHPNIFNLRSYYNVYDPNPRLPMGLRLASPSIQREFDYVFLSRRTFRFACPTTLHRFLDRLSPLQRRQLKCLCLCMFRFWSCNSEVLTRLELWMAACERLPPGLKSIDIQLPDHNVPVFWPNLSTRWTCDQADDRVKVTKERVKELYKKVSRASPRAVISWTGREELGNEDCAILDAALAELETLNE